MSKVKKGFSLDEEVYKALEKEADKERLPVSTTLNRLLRKLLGVTDKK